LQLRARLRRVRSEAPRSVTHFRPSASSHRSRQRASPRAGSLPNDG
jgi:hypothetical protein